VDPVTATLPVVPGSVHLGVPPLCGTAVGHVLAAVSVSVGGGGLADAVSVFEEHAPSVMTNDAAQPTSATEYATGKLLGTGRRSPYAAAKAALEAATRIWAGELAQSNVTVNAVAPGPTETELYRSRSPIGSAEEADLLRALVVDVRGLAFELAAHGAFEHVGVDEGVAVAVGHR
jgi:NAD(P)-dependent dehydrogenase (short-subunit alcohol dehydrogenase family)